MNLKPLSGMRDVTPQEYKERNFLKRKIESVFEAFGFDGIDTPVLEDLETLLGQGGQENEKLMYRVLKRGQALEEAVAKGGGELADMGLRFDLTVPLCRYFAANRARLPLPFKRFHIANVFRAERPARGRFREFYQCDVDILGSPSRLVELEVIAAVTAALDALGFKNCTLRLNSRPFLKRLIDHFQVDPALATPLYILLDKCDKMPLEEICRQIQTLLDPEGRAPSSLALVEFLKQITPLPRPEKMSFLRGLFGNDPVFQELLDLEDLALGIGVETVIDPFLVRGMGYYTGPIFEIQDEKESFSLAGGGRYDQLIGRFLKEEIPACGFSIGFERILVVMKDRGLFPPFSTPLDFYVLRMEESLDGEYLKLARRLRRMDFRVDLALDSRKIGKQIQAAVALGARFALFLGPEEKAREIVKLKDLEAKSERDIPLAELEVALAGLKK